MRSRIARWGNSLAVRIPRDCAAELGLSEGTAVELTVSDRRLVLAPARRKYTLEELVDAITPENRHEETDWGAAAGKEVW